MGAATVTPAMRVRRLPREDRERLALMLKEKSRRRERNRMVGFSPYRFQSKFFAAGRHHAQRLLMAANRVGKTHTGGMEMTYHLTGLYPDGWEGRRFDRPISAWAGSDTAETTRDIVQKELFGEPEDPSKLGTGSIPGDLIARVVPRRGVPDAIGHALILHVSGGHSKISLKSYDQGRAKWQGTKKDVVWLDEEPPRDIYTEAMTRTMGTDGADGGIIYLTFTPLRGYSETVEQFLEGGSPSQTVIAATWDDAPHLTKKDRDDLWGTLPPHERDARSKGVPSMGSGAIYPVSIDDVKCAPFRIPAHWPVLYGLDVGWNRTAAIWLAWDRDADVVYAFSEHYVGEAEPATHAVGIKARGEWIPGEIDPASRGRQQADGKALIDLYRKQGLILREANNAVEAGILEVWLRLSTGRLRIFSTMQHTLSEFGMYRRDEKGRIVKKNDHLMDAMRYGAMGLKHAITKPVYREMVTTPVEDEDGFAF